MFTKFLWISGTAIFHWNDHIGIHIITKLPYPTSQDHPFSPLRLLFLKVVEKAILVRLLKNAQMQGARNPEE